MFHCHKCHHTAHTRTSRYFSDTTKERFSGITSVQTSTVAVLLSPLKLAIVSLFRLAKWFPHHSTRHYQVSKKFSESKSIRYKFRSVTSKLLVQKVIYKNQEAINF